ncbi:hypothetical protein FORMB_26110 [Formosa sp. Hel1_33_131]|jgi:hypothetical protein|uniref:hypothetical protein n=1 Tax=Formosa sp. Hel1_33_131 TaxID=1336794 RepID=UPI00084E15D7|nr:hypothetical protein [Formosa sp. Hel1_33_131]AOR29627.1 hypothetical protein FORMB_26110 [Formosa sp. Hel1_33_131]
MIENNKILFGVGCIIFGVVFLYYNFNNNDYKNDRAWDIAMIFKGLVGGLAVILIGIIAILMHFNFL